MAGATKTDELDFRIVQQVVLGSRSEPRTDRAGAEEIAQTLGVHPNTVAARIRKLTDGEVLLPMTLQVQAPAFGLELAHVFFAVPRERRTEELRNLFRAMPGLQHFIQYVEGWTCSAYGRSFAELQATVAPLAERAMVEPQWDMVSTRDWPALARVRHDALDARILGHLMANARLSLPQAADEMGMPVRTMRRRLDRLFEAKAVRYIPGGSGRPLNMVRGYVIFKLPAGAPRGPAAAEIQRRVKDYWTGRVMETWGHFWLFGRDVEAVAAQVEAVRAVPGVHDVQGRIMEAFEVPRNFPAWLTNALTAGPEERKDLALSGSETLKP